MAVNNFCYIRNLNDFKEFLDGKAIDFVDSDSSCGIVYVNRGGEDDFFFVCDEKVLFRRVNELALDRLLSEMELLEGMANKYYPIYYKSGKLAFSKESFLRMRNKMTGLKKYDNQEYVFSDNLYFPGINDYLAIIDKTQEETTKERHYVWELLKGIVENNGFNISTDELKGDIELADMGSTARGTNLPSVNGMKSDFDYILKVDNDNFGKIKKILVDNLKSISKNIIILKKRIRLMDVKVPGLDKLMDIDISFMSRKNEYFSTEESLSQRLEQIKKQDEYRYRLVLANIMYAKKTLKEKKVYKAARSDRNQCGLGGVGIENWVLQYGGSFLDAAKDFIINSENRSFIEFEKKYMVFDMGCNHLSIDSGLFPYDNYVVKNMRESGYLKMIQVLSELID